MWEGGRAPKARAESRRRRRRERWGVRRGCPLPTGEGLGREQCPSPETFFSIFGLQIATFIVIIYSPTDYWLMNIFAAIAGLFHFRCDASLITEHRPYAATPGVEL